jgi:hypothetical protein
MRDSTYRPIGVAADRGFREVVAEREEPSQLGGGEFVVFEESGDVSHDRINELLQRNAYTYPCADHTHPS